MRIESADAARLVPVLMREHAGGVDRVTVSRPSLADVFLRETGRRLEDG